MIRKEEGPDILSGVEGSFGMTPFILLPFQMNKILFHS